MGDSDTCNSNMRFNNSIVLLSSSRKSSKKIRSIYIDEEDFNIEGDFINQEITINRKPTFNLTNQKFTQENLIEKVLVNKKEPLVEELKTFINCVKTHTQFPVTLKDGIRNLKLCEDIYNNLY